MDVCLVHSRWRDIAVPRVGGSTDPPTRLTIDAVAFAGRCARPATNLLFDDLYVSRPYEGLASRTVDTLEGPADADLCGICGNCLRLHEFVY